MGQRWPQQVHRNGREAEGSLPPAALKRKALLGSVQPQVKAASTGGDGLAGQLPLRTRAEGGRKRRKKG